MSNDLTNLPAWVRRRDGSQVPFEADRICQSLYAAAESLGSASAFVIRELTDVVLHFLAKQDFGSVVTTDQIAAEVEKIVREVGQPQLARHYAELQQKAVAEQPATSISIACTALPKTFVRDCLEAYALQAIYSRDVAAALREGLLHVNGLDAPESLSSLVLETPRLADLPWWPALADWRACGGGRWIVESPEWLCVGHTHPSFTPHLCEHLLSLPTIAERDVELHLNIAEPPFWSAGHPERPLFASGDDDATTFERSNFLDGFLERWKSLDVAGLPAIAWHLHERSFRDDIERRQLHDLIRQALQGKPIRFVFDRPKTPIALAEGLDRKCPGVLVELGLDLPALVQRPDVGRDSATLLKKLPSLARIAVSAARQKRQYLRNLPKDSPLKRRFLIERSAAVVVPLGLDEAVRHATGESPSRSPRSLDFALSLLHTLKTTLNAEGRSVNYDLRVDSPALPLTDATVALTPQLEIAGKLHARAGAGSLTLACADEVPTIFERLQWAWASTSVTRLQLQRAGTVLQQGELAI